MTKRVSQSTRTYGASEPRAFVYCIEFDGGHFAKVGSTDRPRQRLSHLGRTAPFKMRFRHCLEVASREVASDWERIILASCDRYRSQGEWVTLNAHLDDLFAEVTDAVCAMHEMRMSPTEFGRVIDHHSDHYAALARSEVKAITGTVTPSFDGDKRRGVIHARLFQGYGAEDCAVMDGIPACEFRAEVARLRADGSLVAVLRGERLSQRASA